MQNTPIKSLEKLPKINPNHLILLVITELFTAVLSPHVVLYNRRWAVSAPHCCSAVIIGRERSIFYLARQRCDSCVGGQHEQRSCVCTVRMRAWMHLCSCVVETKWCIILQHLHITPLNVCSYLLCNNEITLVLAFTFPSFTLCIFGESSLRVCVGT